MKCGISDNEIVIMEGNSFYVTLSSDASMIEHPTNQGGNFTVELPQTLNINSHFWEVGLDEIVFNQDWTPFLREDVWATVCINDKEGGGWSTCEIEYPDEIQISLLQTEDQFLSSIVQPIIEKALKKAKVSNINLSLTMDPSTRLVEFTTPVKTEDDMPIRLEISAILSRILGFTRKQLKEGRYFQSDTNNVLTSGKSIFPFDLTRGIELLMLYCNIVKPHMVGHAMAPLLRVVDIPARKKQNSESVKRVLQFLRVHYYPVNTDNLSSITIQIYNSGGLAPIQFASPVICHLHFRRRKEWSV